MNQGPVGNYVFIAKKVHKAAAPENVIFDKADEAESLENRKKRLEEVNERIKTFQEELKSAEGEETKEAVKKNLEKWNNLKEKIEIQSTKIKEKD